MCSLSWGPIPWYWMSKVKVTNGSKNTLRCCQGRIALVMALAAEYQYQNTDNLLRGQNNNFAIDYKSELLLKKEVEIFYSISCILLFIYIRARRDL